MTSSLQRHWNAIAPVFHSAPRIGTEVPVWDTEVSFGDTNLLVLIMDQARALAADSRQRSCRVDARPWCHCNRR